MVMPKDIARSYPRRGLTADLGFRSEPAFVGDGAATFPTASDYAQTAASADLALGDTYTVCAWVRHATSSSSTAMSILSSGSAEMTLSFFAGSNPALYVFNGSANMNTTGVFTIDLHTWYHVAIVIKSGGGNSQIFINGIDRTASHSLSFTASGTPNINLGGYLTGGWQGDLANVALFTSSLTEDQVRQAMRASDYASHAAIATLEAFYPLSADFNDSTGNHNATASGSPSFTVNRPQLPRGLDLARGAAQARVYTGRALDQDGSVDRLQGTNFTDATATACTVSFWMYQRDGGPGRIIHNYGGGATAVDRFLAAMYSGSLFIAGEITSGNRLGFVIPSLPLNQWHHVAFVLDGNGTTSLSTTILYLNGEKYDSPGAVGIIWDGITFDIGGTSHGYQNQLIAGVKVFNTKLTDAQARELYHNPEQVLPTGVSASNLRRYYPLSDYNDTGGTGGRYFQDMGADGEPLEDIGSCSMEFAQPVPCPQLGLQQSASRISMQDTTNNTYYVSGVMAGTPFTNQGTLSGWFIMQELPGTTSGDYNPIFILGKYPGGDMLEIVYDNNSGHGTPNIWLTDGGGSIGVRYNHTFELGKLQHVVVTTLATSPYWQLWINGEKKTVSARSFSGARTAWAFGDNLIGGGRWGNSGSYGGTCHFIAAGCAAWNTVLSDSEIGQVYNSGVPGDVSGIASSNLQVWWKCDDLTNLKDYSGNGVSGSVTVGSVAPGLASFPENASGSTIVGDFSLKRKGVSVLNFFRDPSTIDSRAVIPAQESVFPKYPDGFTVSVFFRLQKRGVFSTIYYSTDGAAANQNGVYVTSANQIWFEAGDGGGSATRLRIQTTTLSLDGDWHHYAATITHGTPTTGKAYFDGVLNATDTSVTQTGSPALSDLTIGDYMPIGSNEAAGPIACLRFYRGPLSDDEIEQIYRSDLRLIKGLENE